MNIRQLRYFITIVDEGSVSSAARVLHIAQPALSQHIANLEAELTTDLLVRSSRGVKPTRAGEVLYQHARKIAAQIKQATDDVRNEAETPRGEVSVVVPPMLGVHVAPRLLERVAEKFPEVDLRIMEELGLNVRDMIDNARVDMGILATQDHTPKADHLLLYREPLFLVSRRKKDEPPCNGTSTIKAEAIFDVPLVLSQQSHAVREMVEKLAQESGRTLAPRVTTESTRLRLSYIRSGVTCGVLPWPSFDALWQRGEITAKRLVDPDLTRNIYLIWPKNQPLNAASRAVRQELVDICHDLFEEGVIRGSLVAEREQLKDS